MHGYIFPYSHWVFSFLVCQDWRGVLFPLSGRADIFSIQVFMEVYLLSFSIFANTVVGYLGSSPVRCPVVYGYVGLKGCV